MITNNCNNFSVDRGIPPKMNGMMRDAVMQHDAVYRILGRGVIPPSTEKLLQSFLKYLHSPIVRLP